MKIKFKFRFAIFIVVSFQFYSMLKVFSEEIEVTFEQLEPLSNCESEDFPEDVANLTVIDRYSVECRSREQINWIFEKSIKTKNSDELPFVIMSEMRRCQTSYRNHSHYYYWSKLDVSENYNVTLEDWSVKVFCSTYSLSLVGSPYIELKRSNSCIPVFGEQSFENQLPPVTEYPSKDCPIILLTPDHETNTCTCQIRNQLVQPRFFHCSNLIDCTRLSRQIYERSCPGETRNFCEEMSFEFTKDLNESHPGILYCSGLQSPLQKLNWTVTPLRAAYTPFLPARFKSPLRYSTYPRFQNILPLTNEYELYSELLNLTKIQSSLLKESPITGFYKGFQCSGPKFLFLNEFRWKILTNSNNNLANLTEFFSTYQNTTEDDQLVKSMFFLAKNVDQLPKNISLTIVCEASVWNTNGTVSSNLTINLIGVPPNWIPQVWPSVCLTLDNKFQFECNVDNKTVVKALTWSNVNNVEYCTSNKDDNRKVTCNKFPSQNFSCCVMNEYKQTAEAHFFPDMQSNLVWSYGKYPDCDDHTSPSPDPGEESSTNGVTLTSTTKHVKNSTSTTATTSHTSSEQPTTTPPSDENEKQKTDDSSNTAFVIATSLAISVSIIIIIVLLYFQRRQIARKFFTVFNGIRTKMLPEEVVHEFLEGKNSIDPNDIHGLINSQPFNSKYEIRRRDLALDPKNLLGSGQYGNVMKGFLRRDNSDFSGGQVLMTTVAVKTIKPNADLVYFKALLSEIKILTHLGQHQNIVKFIGACTENIRIREIFVAVEFCAKGDLQKLLRRSRNSFVNLLTEKVDRDYYVTFQVNNEGSKDAVDTDTISTLNLLSWSVGISNGMAYLSLKKVIHGDLAARNVLITEENVAKVSDFSLSHQLVLNYDTYLQTQKMPMPWKYMSLEALQDLNLSIQSDIWSFGVTLWEIFSLGNSPYAGSMWNKDFVDQITSGYRLSKPAFASDDIYELMMKCWTVNPEERPKFTEIYNRLQKIFSSFESSSNGEYYVIQSATTQDSQV